MERTIESVYRTNDGAAEQKKESFNRMG